ncbi:hypothetical protein IE077_001027, partial [Cardiosporidium cionae]
MAVCRCTAAIESGSNRRHPGCFRLSWWSNEKHGKRDFTKFHFFSDGLTKVEEAQRRADEQDYVNEKQLVLNIQKNRIRDIVHAAFEPLHAMLPNPIQTEVAKKIRNYYHPESFKGFMTGFRQKQLSSQNNSAEIAESGKTQQSAYNKMGSS